MGDANVESVGVSVGPDREHGQARRATLLGGRIRRRLLCSALAVVLFGAGICAVAIVQNNVDIAEHPVSFTAGGNRLSGILATPKSGRSPFGLVVFVHGDGPSTAAGQVDGVSFYRFIWEAMAREGYATLAWDKPGVGGSSGNWLYQSMEDRANEVLDVLAWARARSDIDPTRIGLWGGSQAGWVMPRVVASAPGLTFMIAVSVAINWQRQGRYMQLASLGDRNASAAQIEEALRRNDQQRELILKDASYQQYQAELGEHATMSADRWRFVKRNAAADATDDLRTIRGSRPAVLLALAGHDRNVDVAETERVYREELDPGQLQVQHYPGASHSMIRGGVERSELRAALTAIFAPRAMYPAGFLDDLRGFLRRLPRPSAN